ncbi:hypothetical protein Mp_6g21230 [Marchantia polymorpha subsp. ruderalis]|uniref:Uncharacterized protein n=2 Tax=Marchantia polymorpha TaxID=3197 RepID=A0AAF6BUG0_MARPO|nr:hypothetical protein MARPO_0091s0032 [Marchantia polymorpha]BBN15644.1 hypothetical protein Mp_6g21230 [Marchantia polymorpha subsp. ruderalis]|eukprot:PTQ33170.1 hypothetical protein MARPO_0091s0032 [Marchantia polymorpha]
MFRKHAKVREASANNPAVVILRQAETQVCLISSAAGENRERHAAQFEATHRRAQRLEVEPSGDGMGWDGMSTRKRTEAKGKTKRGQREVMAGDVSALAFGNHNADVRIPLGSSRSGSTRRGGEIVNENGEAVRRLGWRRRRSSRSRSRMDSSNKRLPKKKKIHLRILEISAALERPRGEAAAVFTIRIGSSGASPVLMTR